MTTPNVLLFEHQITEFNLEQSLSQQQYGLLKLDYSAFSIDLLKNIAPDIIILTMPSLPAELFTDLLSINQHYPLPIILFTNQASNEQLEQLINLEISEIIVSEAQYFNIASLMTVAMARFKQQQLLKHTLIELRSQLEDRKAIDRAKSILIKTKNFSEDEAYHTLRKLAMDRNITLGAMAKHVIAMAELLK